MARCAFWVLLKMEPSGWIVSSWFPFSTLQKGHRLLKNVEAKAVSHVFSPGFSAICQLGPMLGSEREN